ncbi:MAG: diaminopimelate decarboxylase [Polyangiaceae bacterium]|nr:diaminopimelate decarboxylase [Polyangiaceae bacterium]
MHGLTRTADGALALGDRPLAGLLRDAGAPTPAYVYDLDAMAAGAADTRAALGSDRHLLAYAVKANTAGSVVRTLAQQGAGADVVSRGELEVALAAGVPPARIVMSGVGKSRDDLDLAIGHGIRAIQLESVEEAARVAARARALGRVGRVSLRINPGLEVDTHAHVATGHDEAKFGIALADVAAAWAAVDASPELVAVGVSTHVGSMLTEPEPYVVAGRVACGVARARLASGGRLELVDLGGGFGIDYGGRPAVAPARFVEAALGLLQAEGLDALSLVVEPGRALVAPHGVLVASTLQTKTSGARRWLVIDAGMNDLVRPALYGAKHRVEPVDRLPGGAPWRVVGPVCESADDFGEHPLGDPAPEAVVLRDAGAYGFTMASEYNGRPLPAEIFVADGAVKSVSRSPGLERWVESRLRA